MRRCAYCGRENDASSVVCCGCGTPLTDSIHEPAPASPKAAVTCPHCGAADNYSPALGLGSSFNLGVFLLGGIFAVMFRNAGRPKRLRCNQCEQVFSIRTPGSRVAQVVFWLLVAPGILALGFWLVSVALTLWQG